MPRLLIHLSGKIPSGFPIKPDDYIFHANGLDESRILNGSKPISSVANSIERDLCEQYTHVMCSKMGVGVSDIEFSFLNDYYSYSIRPIFLQMLAVKELSEKYPKRKILILSAKTDCKIIPLFGYRTSESKRGSQDLLGSITAKQMKNNKAFRSAEFISVDGDLLCRDLLRRSVLRLANLIFSTFFLLRLFFGKPDSGLEPSGRTVVLYRTKHQARFASKLLEAGGRLSLLYIPQLTQGGLSLRKRLSRNFGSATFLPFTFSDIWRAAKNAKSLKRKFKGKKNNQGRIVELHAQGLSIELSSAWITSELKLMSIILLYSSFLTLVLKKNRVKKIVNFELVGRMAGIEAACAKDAGAKILTIQTALVSSRPHPVFPYSHKFFADSNETAKLIDANGCRALGSVVFSGTLDSIVPLKAINGFKRIVFYTQPYEPETTKAILLTLCRWASDNNAALRIKLHPRDSISEYADLGLRELFSEQGVDIETLYEWADVTVTRTSSVARESLSHGCPIILTMWSQFDRQIRSDFISRNAGPGYISHSSDELLKLLSDPVKVIRSNVEVCNLIFGESRPADLIKAIFDE
ncbi:hypothetical protein [Marinobacter salsuginis]|uniref:hypothetical protein n=1 Tax=Marinobacter salsuginis TaxID=418719 RepID=UPI00273EBA95|nr:hypothetical protein [Marinobacter salsuginis]